MSWFGAWWDGWLGSWFDGQSSQSQVAPAEIDDGDVADLSLLADVSSSRVAADLVADSGISADVRGPRHTIPLSQFRVASPDPHASCDVVPAPLIVFTDVHGQPTAEVVASFLEDA